MSYKVKLNIFEGPLDLLLFLIKKEKIDVYDIPISKITDQYLEYMDLLKLLDLDIAGEFLVMAANLMYIKSKMLLPVEEGELEEGEELDPREELVKRLLEYKQFKDAAGNLHEMYESNRNVFVRKGETPTKSAYVIDGEEYFEASLFDLITAFRKVLKEVPKEAFHKVIRNEFTVGDKIHEIYHLLTDRSKISFLDLFRQARNKDEIITIFLALLELMKMHEIVVAQKSNFSDIEILRNPEQTKRQDETLGEVEDGKDKTDQDDN